MEILILLIPFSVVIVLGIGVLFWWSVNNGQFDDLEGPGQRVLADDDNPVPATVAASASASASTSALTQIN
ncbi:MAG: cbb3-type cytochrome oxidase assembly protein CcoS [Betaproteobacteria bacterium]